MISGRVHSTESFGSVDGPGVRYVIFMQGCRLRCRYCHNPDTWSTGGGEKRTAEELLDSAERYRGYWGRDGGITVSGGEPLLQIDFLLDLFRNAKLRDINTCVDTAGQPFTREPHFLTKFSELCRLTDLFIVDIKHIDPQRHIALTGSGNENILDMLRYLSENGNPVWIRHVLVPELTDDDEYLRRTQEFISSLNNVKKVEILPYHSFGAYKWEKLGIPYSLNNIQPPDKERVENARRILNCGD